MRIGTFIGRTLSGASGLIAGSTLGLLGTRTLQMQSLEKGIDFARTDASFFANKAVTTFAPMTQQVQEFATKTAVPYLKDAGNTLAETAVASFVDAKTALEQVKIATVPFLKDVGNTITETAVASFADAKTALEQVTTATAPFLKDVGNTITETAVAGVIGAKSIIEQGSTEDRLALGFVAAMVAIAGYQFFAKKSSSEEAPQEISEVTSASKIPLIFTSASAVAIGGILAYENQTAIATFAKELNPTPILTSCVQWAAEKGASALQYVNKLDLRLEDMPRSDKEFDLVEDVLQPIKENFPQAKTFVMDTAIPEIKSALSRVASSGPNLSPFTAQISNFLKVPFSQKTPASINGNWVNQELWAQLNRQHSA